MVKVSKPVTMCATSSSQSLTVSLDALQSHDPDLDPLSYHWDFGDGTTLEGEELRQAAHPYAEALAACLGRLGDRDRKALALRYEDRASRPEMAKALGLSPDGVKTLLRTVRQALADCITRTRRQGSS